MKRMCSGTVALVVLVCAVAVAPADSGTIWDKQIDGKGRFEVLKHFDDEAVLDKETGLVWERSPSDPLLWLNAHGRCNRLTTGDRLGWRLPTLQELASLVDPSVASAPKLPAGHPFENVQTFFPYWSATTAASDASSAWAVNFSNGNLVGGVAKSNGMLVWCVRGGQGMDPQ
jgi:hypothetical protein